MAKLQTHIALFREFEARFRKPRFHFAPPAPVPVSVEAVNAAEHELACRLPMSYREFVTNIGPCTVRGLSDAWGWKNAQAGIPAPFESLWFPQEIVAQCLHPWLAPIPAEIAGGSPVAGDVAWNYLVPFAGDGGGNWHCFRRQNTPVEDSAVYFFDHDGGAIERIAPGLVDLVHLYMQIDPV